MSENDKEGDSEEQSSPKKEWRDPRRRTRNVRGFFAESWKRALATMLASLVVVVIELIRRLIE